MPFITREDGEHFVVPSYRDVIPAKNKSLLKKEVLLLSQSYGEYITLQKKNAAQYEVAFSTDRGYLLGESVWHHFNRPQDMIYCEAIPNSTEAILVIVKSGSVYLDGSFPLDSITEELVIFLTQQNHFDIYVYGDVPISKEPEEGKFSFEHASLKSFTVLENPVFPTLPLLKIYQLQLVKTVLESHGIGVYPIKKIAIVVAMIFMGYMTFTMLSSEQVQEVQAQIFIAPDDPYKLYNETLAAPAPEQVMRSFLQTYNQMSSIPGWRPVEIIYERGTAKANVVTRGAKVQTLFDWARLNNAKIDINTTGIEVSKQILLANRPNQTMIYELNDVIATLLDRLQNVYPGNVLKLAATVTKGSTRSTVVSLDFSGITPMVFALVGDQFQGLPVVVTGITMTLEGDAINTSISLQVVGS